MAQNQDQTLDAEEAADMPAKKGFSFIKLLVILFVLLALGGGGYYAYNNVLQPDIKDKISSMVVRSEAENISVVKKPSVMFTLKPFVVNLAESRGNKVLRVTVALELSAPDVHAEIEDKLQKITDSILVLLSSKTFAEVYSVEGKFRIKDEIATRVNHFLSLGHIRDAYFTEFVIQ